MKTVILPFFSAVLFLALPLAAPCAALLPPQGTQWRPVVVMHGIAGEPEHLEPFCGALARVSSRLVSPASLPGAVLLVSPASIARPPRVRLCLLL